MSETHLDNPGEVKWFANHEPLPVIGPCPHPECSHLTGTIVAWGPNFDHYSLVECTDLCDGACRGWTIEYPYGEGPQFKQGPMKQVRESKGRGHV